MSAEAEPARNANNAPVTCSAASYKSINLLNSPLLKLVWIALEKIYSALDGVGMGIAVNILLAVIDDGMADCAPHRIVGAVFIGDGKGTRGLYRSLDELEDSPACRVFGNLRCNLAAALDGTDYRGFAGGPASRC